MFHVMITFSDDRFAESNLIPFHNSKRLRPLSVQNAKLSHIDFRSSHVAKYDTIIEIYSRINFANVSLQSFLLNVVKLSY